MKIVFESEDIKDILIAHAQSLGIECNALRIDSGYGRIESITAFWDADLEAEVMVPAPIMFAHPLHNHIVRAEVATEF